MKDTSAGKTILTRRSIRKFKADQVPGSVLLQVLEAGRWAPSAKNRQPWKFIVVSKAKIKNEIAKFAGKAERLEGITGTQTRPSIGYGEMVRHAPICLLAFYDSSVSSNVPENRKDVLRLKDIQGVAAAIENILIAAHSYGLGACWMGVYLYSEDQIRELLKTPATAHLMAVVPMGYPAEDPPKPPRNAIEDIVYFERWGGRIG